MAFLAPQRRQRCRRLIRRPQHCEAVYKRLDISRRRGIFEGFLLYVFDSTITTLQTLFLGCIGRNGIRPRGQRDVYLPIKVYTSCTFRMSEPFVA
jgi:hypothetical protein